MYCVLVVDDEPRHRRGIADMVKGLRPECHIFTAKDGEEALRIASGNRVDIIFTDIRMPNMDGMQLLESLRGLRHPVKTVFLSVYGQFDYARKALKLGAFDYLLKPLSQAEMNDMLGKLESAMEAEKRDAREGELLKRKLDSAYPVYEQHVLNRWVRGELGDGDREEIARLLPHAGPGLVVAVKFDAEQIRDVYTQEEFDEFKLSFKMWFQETADAIGRSVSFYADGADPVLASILFPSHEGQWLLRKDLDRLAAFIEQVRVEFGLHIAIGAGNMSADLGKDIGMAFRQACDALDFTFYNGFGSLNVFSEIAYDPLKSVMRAFPSESDIGTALKQLNRTSAAEALEAFISQLMQGKYPSPAHLKERILYMLAGLAKDNDAMLSGEAAGNLIAEMEFRIPACGSLRDLTMKSVQYLNGIIDGMENRKTNKNQAIIHMCMDYLEEHYMEELSMEATARRFFFSPAYFSGLFKLQTSLTFTEYVLRLRVEKAKSFLRDPDRKVAEIALSVGFRDAGYFTRIFKRETGVAPEEYRKNIVL